MHTLKKLLRFGWRLGRNIACRHPAGQRLLFPQDRLAAQFGRGDADYAWHVFEHHFTKLQKSGFSAAGRLLEIGPGRNLGTSLLWWAHCRQTLGSDVQVVCWDVFKNASPEVPGFWIATATELLAAEQPGGGVTSPSLADLHQCLQEVASGSLQPSICYRVEPLQDFEAAMTASGFKFELIYSHAAIEHIWHIDAFWDAVRRLTAVDGWHSFRIDLADHGRRNGNYIEMLEWPEWAYQISMKHIPGAINRWRAHQHIRKLGELGMNILAHEREQRPELPIARDRLAEPFRSIDEAELRTTAVDIVEHLTA